MMNKFQAGIELVMQHTVLKHLTSLNIGVDIVQIKKIIAAKFDIFGSLTKYLLGL